MTDRLTEMEVFQQIVESGSFAAAASRLTLSPQMVGKHVAAMEQRLGTRLLNRSTRRQSLTEAGRLYLDGCRRVLDEMQAIEASIAAQAETPHGELRITAPVAFGTLQLVPLITTFLSTYPHVSVRVDLTDRQVDLISESFDAAFRIGTLPDTSLIGRSLLPYRLIPCASPDYVTKRGMPQHPAELIDHECIDYLFSTYPAPVLWRFSRHGQRPIDFRPRGRLVVNDSRAVIEAALRGHGIVLMAEILVADHLAAGRLVQVLLGFEGPSRPMHLLTPAREAQAPKLRVFLDWAAALFGT